MKYIFADVTKNKTRENKKTRGGRALWAQTPADQSVPTIPAGPQQGLSLPGGTGRVLSITGCTQRSPPKPQPPPGLPAPP